MNDIVEIVRDDPVLIENGYVTIHLNEYNLKVRQKVKRMKGTGAINDFKEPKPIHLEIIKFILENQELNRSNWTVKQVHYLINEQRTKKSLNRYGFSTIQGRISELQYHGVVYLDKSPKWYKLVDEKVRKVILEMKF